MPVGIVLSGGGSKGDFEIGAVRALYNRGIRPAVLVGTSVGALAAAKLAEDPLTDAALTVLENIWFGFQQDSDMWIEDPAFKEIDPIVKYFMHFSWKQFGLNVVALTPMALLGAPGFIAQINSYNLDIAKFVDAASKIFSGSSKSLYLLSPIQQQLQNNLNAISVRNSGVKLRLVMVSLETGNTRYVDEQSQFLDDGTPVDLVTAAMASASIPAIFHPQKLGSENFIDGGVRHVLAVQAALDAGADEVYGITASRAGVDPAAVTPCGSFDCAKIWEIALRATSDIMADQIQEAETNPAGRGWGPNVMVIQPDYTVHDSMTIDPGLIRISYDFGYMRAAELVDFSRSNDPGTEIVLAFLVILSRQITELRSEIWALEYTCAGQRTPDQEVTDPHVILVPDPDTFVLLRRKKVELKNVVEQRELLYGTAPRIKASANAIDFGDVPLCAPQVRTIEVTNVADAGMPPGVEKWWLEWEAHPWGNAAAPNPWATFVSVAGTVPAQAPPPPSASVMDLQLGTPFCTPAALHTPPDTAFSATATANSVAPGESVTVVVRFAPMLTGPAHATLSIPSNDPNNPSLQVSLAATGVDPLATISVSPTIVDFGSVLVGQKSVRILHIANVGCQPLTVGSMIVQSSANANLFQVLSANPPPIGGASSVTIQLGFSPTSTSDAGVVLTGTLLITSSDATHSTVPVSLRGFGRLPLPPPPLQK
jgi:NTE family protein